MGSHNYWEALSNHIFTGEVCGHMNAVMWGDLGIVQQKNTVQGSSPNITMSKLMCLPFNSDFLYLIYCMDIKYNFGPSATKQTGPVSRNKEASVHQLKFISMVINTCLLLKVTMAGLQNQTWQSGTHLTVTIAQRTIEAQRWIVEWHLPTKTDYLNDLLGCLIN